MDPLPQNIKVATSDNDLSVDHMYKAAVYGQIGAFDDYKGRLDSLVTPIGNTVLHLHLGTRRYKVILLDATVIFLRLPFLITWRSTNFVENLLKECPSLLLQANKKGEIPLHLEARYGHLPTVKLLLERAKFAQRGDLEREVDGAKEMVRKRDNEGNTALHNAARYGCFLAVRALIEADPDFVYSANNNGETPLYIAARRGYHLLVAEMLNQCKSVTHPGPKGTTVLHAAVMASSEETVRTILEKKKMLAKETDEKGRSPLHFASHLGYQSIAKALLEYDVSTAYITDIEGKMTALHMAARQGHASIMKDIIRRCPGCCELVDKRGWNFLHFAALALKASAAIQFFGDAIGIKYVSMENLLGQKDENGHTPFQLLATNRHVWLSKSVYVLKYKTGEIRNEKLTMEEEERILNVVKEVEVGSGEVAGVPVRPLRCNKGDRHDRLEKARDSQILVAALISTVCFSAAVAMPGGYNNDDKGPHQGTAILVGNAAFNAFIVSGATSLFSSLLAVLLYFLMARPLSKQSTQLYILAYGLTLFAIGAMVVAFITGAFAVLEPSLWLIITTCFIGFCFFLLPWVVTSCDHRPFAILGSY